MARNSKDSDPQSAPVESSTPGRVRIIIMSDGGPTGRDDVFASDGQGYQCLIKRDVEVSVPVGVLSVLRDAVIENAVTNADGNIVSSYGTPRFNVQVVG